MRAAQQSSTVRGWLLPFLMGCIVALTIIHIPRWFTGHAGIDRGLPSEHPRRLAVFFGDSITQHGFNTATHGWVASLCHFWSRRVDVSNRGFSGYNSRWGLSIIKEVVIDQQPQLVVIFFGANDAVVDAGSTFVPLLEYSSNIESMVVSVQQALPSCVVLLITPPPVWEVKLQEVNMLKGKKIPLDRTNDRTMGYVNSCMSVGKMLKVPVLDAWTSLGGYADSRAQYLSDGLHLNQEGNERLYEAFVTLLRESLPDWLPANIPMHMAGWAELAQSAP